MDRFKKAAESAAKYIIMQLNETTGGHKREEAVKVIADAVENSLRGAYDAGYDDGIAAKAAQIADLLWALKTVLNEVSCCHDCWNLSDRDEEIARVNEILAKHQKENG